MTGLVLNPQTYFADATISMRKDVALPTIPPSYSSEGLLGGNFVEVQARRSRGNAGAGRRDRGHAGARSA